MAVNHEDIQELKKVFDDRYVLQSDCDATQQKINSKFANDDKRIDILAHDFMIVKKLAWIIATSVIGILITSICNLILR